MTGHECRSQAASLLALVTPGCPASERAESADLAAKWRALGALADLDKALADVITDLEIQTPARSGA